MLVETAGLCFEVRGRGRLACSGPAGTMDLWRGSGSLLCGGETDDGEQEQTGCTQFFNIVLRFLYFARVFPV